MKKSFKYIVLLLSLTTITSCSGDFLDHKPTDSVPSEIAATPANAGRLFIGAWRYLMETMSSQANYGYRSLMSADDVMASDVALAGNTYSLGDAYKFTEQTSASSSRGTFAWALLYKTIDNCNTVISLKANDAENTKDFQYAQGQALALRAFCYFHLVQHYQFTYQKDKNALCVPLYTEPTNASTEPKAKATVEAIYTQIFEDLNLAKEKLEGYKNSTVQEKYKPTVNVVNGILARAYLVVGEWDKAVSAAQDARKGFELMTLDLEKEGTDYQGFNEMTNTEWIWAHPQSVSTQSNASSYGFSYLDVTRPSGYCSMLADPHFRDIFEKEDPRRKLFQWMRNGNLGYRKFIGRSDQTADIVLMRSSEMCLIEAEGMARSANYTISDAVKPLNELRKSRALKDYDLTGKTKEDLVKEILLERRRELWGEGFGITDILRTQQSVVRTALTPDYIKSIDEIKKVTGDNGKEEYVVSCWQANGKYIDKTPAGHLTTAFPDGSQFVPDSKYYIYVIPEKETNANPNL